MRIIIIQAEIEEAIRNHILQQVNINENMEILIDLKATRSEQGYTAEIDIVRKSEQDVSSTPIRVESPAPAPEAPKSLGIAETVKATRTRQAKPVEAPTTESAKEEVEAEPETEMAISSGEERVEPQTETSPAPAPAPVGAKRSLFGNVTQPKN